MAYCQGFIPYFNNELIISFVSHEISAECPRVTLTLLISGGTMSSGEGVGKGPSPSSLCL